MPTQDSAEPKRRRTILSVRVDLLKIALEDNLNLSDILEHSLLDYCVKKRGEKWLEENEDWIKAYNERIDHNGVFASRWRSF